MERNRTRWVNPTGTHLLSRPTHTHTHTSTNLRRPRKPVHGPHFAVATHHQKLLTHTEDSFFISSFFWQNILSPNQKKSTRANARLITPRWRRLGVLYSESWIAYVVWSPFAQVGGLGSEVPCGTSAYTPTITACWATVKTLIAEK